MRIAVLGDVHANARALAAALSTVDAAGYDRLVMVGDLLTYGIDVEATLELVRQRSADARTVLLRGNHDALYRDLQAGGSEYGGRLPHWIRESVEWTLARLPSDLWQCLPFADEWCVDTMLFAHAGPFGAGQWAYLDSEADHARAARELDERGFRAGVFGHTHRGKWYRILDGEGRFLPQPAGELGRDAVHILNAGAIGQPRDASDRRPFVLWLTVGGGGPAAGTIRFARQYFEYDVAAHVRALAGSGLSAATVDRLAGFFQGSVAG